MKTLIVMTGVGFGIIGLVLWVGLAGDPGRSNANACANDSSRSCLRYGRDGSVRTVLQDGSVRIIQPARH